MIDARDHLIHHGLVAADAALQVTALTGGYWNTVSRVQGAGLDWVVKVFADQVGWVLFPILPDDEVRALQVLAGCGVAPDLVAFQPKTAALPAVLVYQWVDGPMWTQDVAPVASLFRRLHAVVTDGFRSVPTSADGICEQGDRLLAAADPSDQRRLAALRPSALVPPARRRVLIHTDAGPGNVIVSADGPRLIDWQCPALGDAAEDLFTFLSPAFQVLYGCEPLSPAEREAMLAAYDDPSVVARLSALAPALTYRMGAYCAARRLALAAADEAAADRYARALDLSLADLHEGPR